MAKWQHEASSRIELEFKYVVAHHALQSCDPSGLLHVPYPLLSSTPSAAPSDEAHLPVLPPYGFLWPPPRSVLNQGFLFVGVAVESAVARVCCEGGARVSTNIVVRDMANRGDKDFAH